MLVFFNSQILTRNPASSQQTTVLPQKMWADNLPDGGIVLGLEPLDGVVLGDAVRVANLGLATLALGNTGTGTAPVYLSAC